jgi:hypothetical protein
MEVISLVIMFSMFDLSYSCTGEFHRTLSEDSVSVYCDAPTNTPHRGLQIDPGPVTVNVNNVVLQNCNWEAVEAYDDGVWPTSIIIVLSCPPQPIALKDKR